MGSVSLAAKVKRITKRRTDPLEFAIHSAVVRELRKRAAPGVRFFHCPNEGKRSAKYAAGLTALGLSAGVPDLVLVRAMIKCPTCSSARCVAYCGTCQGSGIVTPAMAALELKRLREKPTKAQTAWLSHLAAAGWHTGVADTIDGAIALLEEWGMLACK